MLEEGFITKEQYNESLKEPLPEHPHWRKFEAPYFVEVLRQELESKYGDRLYKDGLRIYATIDYNLQKKAEEVVTKGLAEIHKRTKPQVQAALIAMELKTGYVKPLLEGMTSGKLSITEFFLCVSLVVLLSLLFTLLLLWRATALMI